MQIRQLEGYRGRMYASPDGSYKSVKNGDTVIRCSYGNLLWIVEVCKGDDEWERLATCITEYEAIGTMWCHLHRLCS